MTIYERILQFGFKRLPILVIALITGILMVFFLLSQTTFSAIPFTDLIELDSRNNYFQGKNLPALSLIFSILFIITCGLLTAIPIAVTLAFNYNRIQNFKPLSKSILEVLAAIPTVFYGFVLMLIILSTAQHLFSIPLFNAFFLGITFGIMLIPTIVNLTENAFSDIPIHIFEGAYGLGANKFQIAFHILIPLAAPQIIAATLIAVSKAIAEIILIGMVAGIFKNDISPLTVLLLMTFLFSGSAVFLRNFKKPTTADN